MKEFFCGEVIIVRCYISLKLLRIEVNFILILLCLDEKNTRRRRMLNWAKCLIQMIQMFPCSQLELTRLEKWNGGHVPNGTLANVKEGCTTLK